MFSIGHILFIVICLPLAIGLAIFCAKKFGWNKRVLYAVLGIAIASEITKVFFFMQKMPMTDVHGNETGHGYFLAPDQLPFMLCSIQIIFILLITFVKNKKFLTVLMAFMFPTLIGGGAMAFVVPNNPVNFGFGSVIAFQFFIYHAMLVFLGIYMYLTKPVDFTIKSYFTAYLVLLVVAFLMIYVNSALGGPDKNTNFMYVVRGPMEGTSVDFPYMNTNHGWYVYMLQMASMAVLWFTILYSPVFYKAFRGWQAKRRGVAAIATAADEGAEAVEPATQKAEKTKTPKKNN